MSSCEHVLEVRGFCASCGQDMNHLRFLARRKGETVEPVAFSNDDIAVKKSVAKKKSLEHREKLISQNRLALVLDLDKTLLHSTIDPRASAIEGNVVIDHDSIKRFNLDPQDLPQPDGVNLVWRFELKNIEYFLKFRPGLIDFLSRFETLYEFTIFTAGSRIYAEKIAEILDPQRRFFGSRVVSRDDISDIWKIDNQIFKSLERIFPFDDSFAVILDDSPGVWVGNLENLIQVQPYTYFRGMEDVNVFANTSESTNPNFAEPESVSKRSSSSKPLLPALQPVSIPEHLEVLLLDPIANVPSQRSPSQRQLRSDLTNLKSIAKVLKEAHRKFFKKQASSIKPILTFLKELVFKDVCICFSDLYPPEHADSNMYVETVTRFGARVADSLDDSVTHVVARNPKSSKVQEAFGKLGVFIVRADWINASIANYNRQKEESFPLQGIPHQITKKHLQKVKKVSSKEPGPSNPLKRTLENLSFTEQAAPKKTKTLASPSKNDFLDDFY